MGSCHRNNILKKRVRYFLLFFSVAACVLSMSLVFGLKSYASPAVFNPDVELEALNSNGTVDTLNIKVAGNTKRYNDLDNISKMVYTRVNIYVAAESAFPTKVIPQFSNTGWLCCCGNKNAADSQNCEVCGREKSWQESSVTATALEETKQKLISDPNERTLHDKTNYAQNKYLEDDKQIQEKIQQYEKAIENVAIAEKKRERRKLMVLPKLALWIGTVYLIARILNWLINKV